ncbi:MAG: metallophosphoesterase [Rhodospirillales bacterium]
MLSARAPVCPLDRRRCEEYHQAMDSHADVARRTLEDDVSRLERRLGRVHARQRIGIERDWEAHVFGHGINFFHIENWYSIHGLMGLALKLSGLYWRGRRNAEAVRVHENVVTSPRLPPTFDGFTVLQLTDLHVEMNARTIARLCALVDDLAYDLCVITGDFRAKTFGPFDAMLAGLAPLCATLRGPVYGVLGNHDTILMVPGLEDLGIRMLLNETVVIERERAQIYLGGIDDAHYYRVDNIEKAASSIPDGAFSVLLSHTPEIFRQAAHAGFDLLLAGHTHGGQICLPGGIPVTLDSVLPRRLGAGAWRHHGMAGYTAAGVGACIVPVRFNCPPEITLHRLVRD